MSLVKGQDSNGNPVIDTLSAIEAIKFESAITVQSAFEKGTRVFIYKKENENELYTLLLNMITGVNLSLSVKEPITNFQALQVVDSIMTDYKHLTIEDIALCFRRGKNGFYGPVYQKLDIETFGNWLRSYVQSEEYLSYLENRHTELNKPTKEEENKRGRSPELQQMINNLINRLDNEAKNERMSEVVKTDYIENLESFIKHYPESYISGLEMHYLEKMKEAPTPTFAKGLEVIKKERERRIKIIEEKDKPTI